MSDFEIRVLQVLPALEQGGVERGTLEMAEHIIKKGWKSYVASAGGQMVKPLTNAGSQHFQLQLKPRTPWHIAYNTYQLVQIIRQNQINLVHARSRGPAWSAYWACKITKTPFVTTFHGTYSHQNAFKRWYNSVMLKGEKVIAISEFIRRHIRKTYPDTTCDIFVVPRGYDATEFTPKGLSKETFTHICQQHGIPSGFPIILMPGRLTRWKGQHILLEALISVKQLPWICLFVGGAGKKHHYLAELQKMALDNGIGDRVFFVGNQKDMAPLYANATLTVSASTDPEAFGRVAIESQAMKTPVIATAHGGSLETVIDRSTGFLVPPSDAKMLANTLKDALSNPKKLNEMGEKAYDWVSQNFTTEQMCAGEFAVYKQVLGIK